MAIVILYADALHIPFSTLFTNPSFQVLSNEGPPFRTILVHQFNHFIILLKIK